MVFKCLIFLVILIIYYKEMVEKLLKNQNSVLGIEINICDIMRVCICILMRISLWIFIENSVCIK